jgi:hypothetical protein
MLRVLRGEIASSTGAKPILDNEPAVSNRASFMVTTSMQEVANAVVRRAQRQGFVLPSHIREELAQTSIPPEQWKQVLSLSRPSLRYRQGRYYYHPSVSPRMREAQQHHRAIQHAVRQLIRQYKKTHAETERRQRGRTDFVQPVKVQLEDQREVTLLSRDLSETGIRLIGTRSFLGQRLRVLIPSTENQEPIPFVVRILWTCSVGDGLFENGGNFLEMSVDGYEQPQSSNNSPSVPDEPAGEA